MSPNHNPSWPHAHQCFGGSQINFDPNLLIKNDLLLSIHLLSYIKLQSLPDDNERISFLQDLQKKLAEKKTTELTEPKAMLLWGFLIMSYGHIIKRADETKKQLLIIGRYFQINIAQPENWSDGLLGAIGLKKDSQSNKKKILLRCLSCAIFSMFVFARDWQTSSEYVNAMAELKSTLNNKKFTDVRMTGLQAIDFIESKKDTMIDGFNDTISKLIRLFYQEPFLNSIEYFYHW